MWSVLLVWCVVFWVCFSVGWLICVGVVLYNVVFFIYCFEFVMKFDIYLNYCLVVFQDFLFEFVFLMCLMIVIKEIVKWEDGNEYLLVKVDIFSYLYLFYIGKQKMLDVGGCVDKFCCCYVQK